MGDVTAADTSCWRDDDDDDNNSDDRDEEGEEGEEGIAERRMALMVEIRLLIPLMPAPIRPIPLPTVPAGVASKR